MKNLFFWRLFLQNKNCWHFESLMNRIFWQNFTILKNKGIGVSYCLNYGPSKLLLHLIEYLLDQLNKKHTKTAVNSTIQFFWKPLSEEICGKSLKLFGPRTTKWQPCKIFAKLKGNHLLIANIFKLHKY